MKKDNVDSSRKFVEGIPFKYPDFMCEQLNVIKDAGFVDPILFGGALRDRFMGLRDFKDLDIRIHVGNDNFTRAIFDYAFSLSVGLSEPSDRIVDIFAEKTGIIINNVKRHEFSTNFVGEKIVGNKSVEFDLSLRFNENEVSQKESLEPLVVSDCPLCSVSMDADGKTYMDVKFPDHAEGLIYEPILHTRSEIIYALRRFEYLSGKIDGLKLQQTFLNKAIMKSYIHAKDNAPWAVEVAKSLRNLKRSAVKLMEFPKFGK